MDFRQKVIDREMSKPGLRGRINAFCASCIYDPASGTGGWLQQVTICTSYKCPLYDVRPQTTADTPENQGGKAIKTTQLDDFSEKSSTETALEKGAVK